MNVTDARRLLDIGHTRTMQAVLDGFDRQAAQTAAELLTAPDGEIADRLRAWTDLVEALDVATAAALKQPQHRDAERKEPSDSSAVDETVPWPEQPDVSTVHVMLREWAATKRDVPDDFFEGDIVVSDASVGEHTLRRLMEVRSEERRSCPGDRAPTIPNVYTGRLADVELPRATAVVEETFEFIADGSVATERCSQCQGGQRRCGSCGGSGSQRCRTSEQCDVCSGSGEVRELPSDYSSRKVRCGGCVGRGQIPCRRCAGSGRVPCANCAANGYVACTTCDATGWLTSFSYGLIKREVRPEVAGGVEPESPIAKTSRKVPWRHYNLSGRGVPSGLPDQEQARLRPILPPRSGELLRDLDVAILPVTAVDYRNGDAQERLFIVGDSKEIVAPSVATRHRRRVLLAVGAAILVIGAIIAILVVLGVIGGGNNEQSEPTISGAEIERHFRDETTAVAGSGALPETTACPGGDFGDGETVTCSFQLEDGRSVELLVTPQWDGNDWRLEADVGAIG